MFVMPSSSARCSQLPRCVDKVPFYTALRKLRDHLRGDLPCLDDSEVTFPDLELKVEPKKEKFNAEIKQESIDPDTNVHLTSEQQASSGTFRLNIEIKTENDSAAGKKRKGRRKRTSTAATDRNEAAASAADSSLSRTVCSPYFQPWLQPSSYFADSLATRNCCTTAAGGCEQVKQETPIDFSQYGCMPEDLSVAGSIGSMVPLPNLDFAGLQTNL